MGSAILADLDGTGRERLGQVNLEKGTSDLENVAHDPQSLQNIGAMIKRLDSDERQRTLPSLLTAPLNILKPAEELVTRRPGVVGSRLVVPVDTSNSQICVFAVVMSLEM